MRIQKNAHNERNVLLNKERDGDLTELFATFPPAEPAKDFMFVNKLQYFFLLFD